MMALNTIIKCPRVQSVKREAPLDTDSPGRPPVSEPTQRSYNGLRFPYCDIREAKHPTYAKFAYKTLKFHEQLRGMKWKMGTSTRLPTRTEVEDSWLYQIEAGKLGRKTRIKLINQMTNREANTMWDNIKDEIIGMIPVPRTPTTRKLAIGKPSNLCPSTCQRHTIGVPPRATQQRHRMKRGHGAEDEDPNKRLKASAHSWTQRKNKQRRARKEEKWAAALESPTE